MTIYGVGYRSLRYEVEPRHRRWAPILAQEFRTLFRSRWGVFLFIACMLPSIASLGILLLQMGVLRIGPVDFDFSGMIEGMGPDARQNARSVLFYVVPVYGEGFVPFLVLSSLVSCRSIAKDRQTNALEIYWTRGITPAEYFLGKWFGSACLLGALFVAAPLVLWVLGVFLADDWGFLTATVGFVPVALLGNALLTLVSTYLATAFSAMSRSPNMAAILWLFLIVGSEAVANILREILREQAWMAVSPWASLTRLLQWMCGIAPPPFQTYSPAAAAAAVAACVCLLTGLMLRRLRLLEAVS